MGEKHAKKAKSVQESASGREEQACLAADSGDAGNSEPLCEQELEKKEVAPGPQRLADATAYTADYLFKCVNDTFQMEMDRYDSLSSTASRLLTCISIIAVAVMAGIGIVQSAFAAAGLTLVLVGFALVEFAILVGAFLTALCSQYRFKYKALATPADFAAAAESYEPELENAKASAIQYAKTIDPVYISLRGRNDSIRKLVTASTTCLMVAIGALVIFCIAGLIILF